MGIDAVAAFVNVLVLGMRSNVTVIVMSSVFVKVPESRKNV
jgi:hypothetical protein